MLLWIDAQLSPALAHWMTSTLRIQAIAVRDLGLRDAKDEEIFTAAKKANAAVDADFPALLARHGAPPRVIWLRCGNTSNAMLRALLERMWSDINTALARGDMLVEIRDTPKQAN